VGGNPGISEGETMSDRPNPGLDMALLVALRKLEKLIDLGISVLEKQFPEAKEDDGQNR
jgi:hypothetical protein